MQGRFLYEWNNSHKWVKLDFFSVSIQNEFLYAPCRPVTNRLYRMFHIKNIKELNISTNVF